MLPLPAALRPDLNLRLGRSSRLGAVRLGMALIGATLHSEMRSVKRPKNLGLFLAAVRVRGTL
jgi:hypothetical protein